MGLFNPQASLASVCNREESGSSVVTNFALYCDSAVCAVLSLKLLLEQLLGHAGYTVVCSQVAHTLGLDMHSLGYSKSLLLPDF